MLDGWIGWIGWIYLRTLLLLEHLAVLITSKPYLKRCCTHGISVCVLCSSDESDIVSICSSNCSGILMFVRVCMLVILLMLMIGIMLVVMVVVVVVVVDMHVLVHSGVFVLLQVFVILVMLVHVLAEVLMGVAVFIRLLAGSEACVLTSLCSTKSFSRCLLHCPQYSRVEHFLQLDRAKVEGVHGHAFDGGKQEPVADDQRSESESDKKCSN